MDLNSPVMWVSRVSPKLWFVLWVSSCYSQSKTFHFRESLTNKNFLSKVLLWINWALAPSRSKHFWDERWHKVGQSVLPNKASSNRVVCCFGGLQRLARSICVFGKRVETTLATGESYDFDGGLGSRLEKVLYLEWLFRLQDCRPLTWIIYVLLNNNYHLGQKMKRFGCFEILILVVVYAQSQSWWF